MNDDTDDLDEFARMFGARPETAPVGLLPAVGPSVPPTLPPAHAGSPGDPLAWLLTPTTPVAPAESTPVVPVAVAAAPTQVLPTRRSIAAEAAAASRASGRRNLVILGGIGAVVVILVVVMILVLVAKSAPTPAAAGAASDSPSSSATSTPSESTTPTPSDTPTPTPTPTPTTSRVVVPPPPGPLSVTASVSQQPNCSDAPVTVAIGYTSANAATLNLASSDGTVNMNITPAASGTIPSVPYQCGAGESYTLTVYSSAEGVTPATASVSPVPAG